jgi:hypothetical protein
MLVMRKYIFSIFALVVGINGHAQTFTIINKSAIDLNYKITASLDVCDRYCMHNDKINANTIVVWTKIDSLSWDCDKMPRHFSSFTINNNKEVGNCWENRTTHTIKNIASNITYTWVTDEQTKNITVTLEPAPNTARK